MKPISYFSYVRLALLTSFFSILMASAAPRTIEGLTILYHQIVYGQYFEEHHFLDQITTQFSAQVSVDDKTIDYYGGIHPASLQQLIDVYEKNPEVTHVNFTSTGGALLVVDRYVNFFVDNNLIFVVKSDGFCLSACASIFASLLNKSSDLVVFEERGYVGFHNPSLIFQNLWVVPPFEIHNQAASSGIRFAAHLIQIGLSPEAVLYINSQTSGNSFFVGGQSLEEFKEFISGKATPRFSVNQFRERFR